MKLACLLLISWRHLFMRPGTMSHRSFEQSAIVKVVSESNFKRVGLGRIVSGDFQDETILAKRRKHGRSYD